MKNLYNTERLFEDLFGVRREFDEMFNRILTGKPWGYELPEFTKEFKKEFNIAPAVETYVDKEAKKYVCRVALSGVEPKDVQVQAQGNLLVIRGERKLTHREKEAELFEREIALRRIRAVEIAFTLGDTRTVRELASQLTGIRTPPKVAAKVLLCRSRGVPGGVLRTLFGARQAK